jgi:hypothetical protein
MRYEQIPVAVVKKMLGEPPQEQGNGQDWRALAQLVQTETDSTKMIDLVQQMIEKFDEEEDRKGSRSAKK